MKARVEAGEPIRQMDPVFREIFEHHAKIRMDVEDIPGGARVTETSDDPQIVQLIRQHAQRAVSEPTACSARCSLRRCRPVIPDRRSAYGTTVTCTRAGSRYRGS